MKIKVGILGYGNLGKAVELYLQDEKSIQLVAIFSNRRNIVSPFKTPTFHKNDILDFKNKIDLLILCSGSKEDMLSDAPYYTEHFNTINTFDTHSLIPQLYDSLNKIAKRTHHFAILSTGWDPGLFSTVKATFSQILK